MLKIDIKPKEYHTAEPYPHMVFDNVLDEEFGYALQREILEIPDDQFDRYSNPFEQKWTLRDKNNLPPLSQQLYNYLQSEECLEQLSELVGIELINDPNKNFWGIHKYDDGDKLDIHVDAGAHPVNKMKKEITLGIYLSKNWKEENGGHLEVWEGENSKNNDAKLIKCANKVLPIFNRMIIFSCTDYSWHGNPHPVKCEGDEKRIFFTLSYLSKRDEYENKRQKAYFVKLPDEPEDEEKDKLRLLRADPEKYKEVYRV
jgi:Rps23 Pro-64 3,4-dihydroxylase Tpa1-like proline 4-hydroxylase